MDYSGGTGVRNRWTSTPHLNRRRGEEVLPSACQARVAVEADIKLGWEQYVGTEGAVVGMDGFGASAPAKVLYEKFGITTKQVVKEAKALLKG